MKHPSPESLSKLIFRMTLVGAAVFIAVAVFVLQLPEQPAPSPSSAGAIAHSSR